MKKINYIVIVYFVFCCQGCISPRIMQTAKPLKKGEFETSAGLSGFASSESVLGNGDIMIRYGLDNKSDIGLGLGLPGIGHYTFDYKRQLYVSQNKSVYLSSGLSVEAFLPDENSSFVPAFSIPLYFSFNHNGKVVPYLTQRYTLSFLGWNYFRYRDSQLPLYDDAHYKNTMLYSGGIGLRIGKKRKLFIEATYFLHYDFYLQNYFSTTNNQWDYERGQSFENAGFQLTFGFIFSD